LKDAQKWVRLQLTQFGPKLMAWTARQSNPAIGCNEKFNEKIWNNDMFNIVEQWLTEQYIETAVTVTMPGGAETYLMPGDNAVTALARIKRKVDEEYRMLAERFLSFMAEDPTDALVTFC